MKRREWLLAALGVILVALGAGMVWVSHGASRDLVLSEACHTPLRVLEPPTGRPTGSAVVFHGLSANRHLMQTTGQWLSALGLRIFLLDFPGHGDSTDPFTYAHAEQCAARLLDELAERGEINPDQTILVGHSLGAVISMRMADRLPTAATIAISPPPMLPIAPRLPGSPNFTLPRRMPVNLLVLVGGWEPSFAHLADQALLRAAGGERLEAEDFDERRAAKLAVIPRATHTSLVFDPRVKGWMVDWTRRALHLSTVESQPLGSPVLGSTLGFVGLALLFPLATSALTASPRVRARESEVTSPPGFLRLVVLWVLASLFSVLLLRYWEPLRFLRMMTGAYLASFLLLVGALLLILQPRREKATLRLDLGPMAVAAMLGLLTVLTVGAWLNWQLIDAWMNLPRWLRFFPLVLAFLPYSAVEEIALGPAGARSRPARLGLFLLLRALLWLMLMFGLYALDSRQILILLLSVYLALLAILQRWAIDAVGRRTGSPGAAVLFGAILNAWFVAAVFPLT
ncbi:MAG TPA: alpha/beta fold hydrolase [Candidatus Acidoferrales bacterium]|nr:alpha/beta fold hydrolase [Candidatus Acidoferrales bacterium]